jgi:hypothetical protein
MAKESWNRGHEALVRAARQAVELQDHHGPLPAGGDPGTREGPGNRVFARVAGIGGGRAARGSRAIGTPSAAGRARPLHLIHGGASSHWRSGYILPRPGPVNPPLRRGPGPGTGELGAIGADAPVRDHIKRAGNITNCAQRVTARAMVADNKTDAGDVGTPELTSPRLHQGPGRAQPAAQPAARAAARRSPRRPAGRLIGRLLPQAASAVPAGRPSPVAFGT